MVAIGHSYDVGYYLKLATVGKLTAVAVFEVASFPGIIPMVTIPYFYVILSWLYILSPHLATLHDNQRALVSDKLVVLNGFIIESTAVTPKLPIKVGTFEPEPG